MHACIYDTCVFDKKPFKNKLHNYDATRVCRYIFLARIALSMALARVIFSLPNMSLITLALWCKEEEPKARRVTSRVKKVHLASFL